LAWSGPCRDRHSSAFARSDAHPPRARVAADGRRQHGDRAQARRAAAAALEVAEGLGAAPPATEIRQLAQRGRLDLTSQPQAQPDPADHRLDITAREAEVLALPAAGRTNREIGRTLFSSEKTASVHVGKLLRKLGAANRVEAAAIAQRLGLPDNRDAPS
jgi:DNA-binding NarL/FixJ family response regulator